MPIYRVLQDGTEVLNTTTDEYQGLEPFGDYRGRPDQGTVELYVDDELIGVQTAGED